mgnify:CR=1 FL=1
MKIKYLITFILILLSNTALSVETDVITREIVNRNAPNKPSKYIKICDHDFNRDWCEGYFSAVIASLEKQKIDLCLPKNKVSRYSFDGVWAITKSWLYRQTDSQEIKFYDAVELALTENNGC